VLRMKLLVTGASGFLGSSILREAARRGIDVRGVARHAAADGQLAPSEFVKADLRDQDQAQHALRGVDVVIHAAAPRGESADFRIDTVQMIESLLAAMDRA